jgi:hypothetical protein
METAPFREAMRVWSREVEIATQLALKATAKAIVEEERKRVPVASGRLKASIRQSKVKPEAEPRSFKVNVGAMGASKLYRGKVEAKTHFAADAMQEAGRLMEERVVAAVSKTVTRIGG